MKRNNLIIGSLSLLTFGAMMFVVPSNPFKKSSYQATNLKLTETKNANDAAKWLAERYIDLATGQRITDERLSELLQQEKNRKRASFSFAELGPDNIGGRTRAIVVDKDNPNLIYAGGVSGGLFKSEDGANTWSRVDEFPGLPFISTATQTADGTFFVGTGMSVGFSDSWPGDGFYYKTVDSDTWEKVPGNHNRINEAVSYEGSNKVYFGTDAGLKSWAVGDATVATLSTGLSGSCDALVISNDGSVIVAGFSGTRTAVSKDNGATFTNVSGSANSGKVPQGSARIEYAISQIRNSAGEYTVYASRTGGNLDGMHVSTNGGETWSQFMGAAGSPSELDIYRDQGTYNSILTVDPTNTERLIIGGIDLWEWKQQVANPPVGGFEQLSVWFSSPTSPTYVHADNHELKWDKNNRLLIGNDGGIGISTDLGQTFFPANRGYNVTQFYGIAFDKHGAVMGGAQDNGTLYNDFTGYSYNSFTEIGGGDGFECEISFFNPNVIFSSIYYNEIRRSGDKGQSSGGFGPPYPASYGTVGEGGGAFPFHTEFVLAEYYDENSTDRVIYSPRKNYSANSIVRVPSLSSGDTINYVTPIALHYDDTVFANPSLTRTDNRVKGVGSNVVYDLGQNAFTFVSDVAPTGISVNDVITVNGITITVELVTPYTHYFGQNPATNEILDMMEEEEVFNVTWDTLSVKDPFQSWFVVHVPVNGGELWGTRDALRFSIASPKWEKFASNIGASGQVDIEFSKDLNNMYVSAGNGIFRIDGLGSIYSQSATFNADAAAAGAAKEQLIGGSFEGIALNANNPDDLVLFPGFSGTIRRSSNATSSNATFTSIGNLGVACYDGIIDCEDSEIIIVGTAFGVKVTENGGTTWEDASAGFENVPVYEVRQNTRKWDEGSYRYREVYLGTFGRGIWVSQDLLNLENNNSNKANKLKTQLKVYPNPAKDVTAISFNSLSNDNVMISVYNISGTLVKTINEKNMSKGQQTISIDVNDLRKGTYIVKFSQGKYQETTKFIKL